MAQLVILNREIKLNSRGFIPLVDNEVHLIELSLWDGARGDEQTHTC